MGDSLKNVTPGPWLIEPSSSGGYRIAAKQGPISVSPAIVGGIADARIIAAAPDMADALADLIEAATREVNDPVTFKGGGGDLLARLSDARSALRKAGGGDGDR